MNSGLAALPLSSIKSARSAAAMALREHASLPEITDAPVKIIGMGGNPSSRQEYKKDTSSYIGIEVTMRFLFLQRERISLLQLASNYGPYLHYLRYYDGMENVLGIDLAGLAVSYGKSIGSPVEWGDARQITLPSASWDAVITHDFLNTKDFKYPISLVRQDIHRLLKPNGWHISYGEHMTWTHTERSRPFFSAQQFSDGAKLDFPELKPVMVFQKA